MSVLIQLLVDCEEQLRTVGEFFWADKIKCVLQKNSARIDRYFLEEILSWYGGMGSFNDLLISEYNGHTLNGADEGELNDILLKTRNAIYVEAKSLARDIDMDN